MSKEAYIAECRRIRQNRENTERIIRDNMTRRMFPQNEERAVAFARAIARDTLKQKTDLSGYYVK